MPYSLSTVSNRCLFSSNGLRRSIISAADTSGLDQIKLPNPIDPFKLGQLYGSAIMVHRQRPECASAMGFVAMAWTQVEQALIRLLSSSLGSVSNNADGSRSLRSNGLLAAAVSEAETIRVRLKIADATYGRLVAGTALEPRWSVASAGLRKRSRERNTVVHGQYSWSEKRPDHLVYTPQRSGSCMLWNEKDFLDVAARIMSLYEELNSLHTDTVEALGAGTIAHLP